MSEPLSEDALRAWMDRMGGPLLGIAMGILKDRARAEDIVQETFLRLWRRPPDQGEPVYPSWLRTVVTNLSINALKQRRRQAASVETIEAEAPGAATQAQAGLAAREDLDRVERALARLDPAKRAIIMLRAQDDLAYEDIARVLGIPVGTVMSRLNRARLALQRELEAMDQESRGSSFDIRRYRAAGGA
ncbi:MAG: RNA polymerase sigma factor [Phycisphaeraceae bacterium]|nr:RNA polymerase sigma factor [Phycisphaeraceae bacterium]